MEKTEALCFSSCKTDLLLLRSDDIWSTLLLFVFNATASDPEAKHKLLAGFLLLCILYVLWL